MKSPVQQIELRFATRERIPNQVFRDNANLEFVFADSSLLTAPEGWDVLKKCARYFGDSEIFAVAVEDLATLEDIQAQRSLRIDSDATRELFLHWLDNEVDSSGAPLYIDARVIAFTGSTGAWGLWIEQDSELAVLGADGTALSAVIQGELSTSLWTPPTGVAALLEPAYYPNSVPDALLKRISQEYSATPSPRST